MELFAKIQCMDENFDVSKHVSLDCGDNEERFLWHKDTFYCELDDKKIEFRLVVRAQDLYSLCGDENERGKLYIDVLLVPLAKHCNQETLDKARTDPDHPTDEGDLLDYGCYVVMASEHLTIDSDEPMSTKLGQEKIKAAVAACSLIGGMCGIYLDESKNRLGSTGWDYLDEWCGSGTDFVKATLKRWKK